MSYMPTNRSEEHDELAKNLNIPNLSKDIIDSEHQKAIRQGNFKIDNNDGNQTQWAYIFPNKNINIKQEIENSSLRR